MNGVRYSLQRAREQREVQRQVSRLLEGSLEYDLPYEDCAAMRVRIGGKLKKLSWVAKFRPHRLESLMADTEPGSVLFFAITQVYNANEQRIKEAVDPMRRRLQNACLRGFRRGLTVPTVLERRQIRPGAFNEFLTAYARN
jgi:hypothetical protein